MIHVQGKNDLDTDLRQEALEDLNELPTKVLGRLVALSKSKKALGYLQTEKGFATIKGFLGL
ncbi:MAG: hypothetical protein AAF599_06315 [Bacteroidota bacterium]